MAGDGSDALGMELHAVQRPLAMGNAHDETVLCPGIDAQALGQAAAFDDQRMIARRLERVRQAGKDPAGVMMDCRELAVHRLGRANDLAAHRLADRLMTEADTEQRYIAGATHQFETDARAIGIAWPGRD